MSQQMRGRIVSSIKNKGDDRLYLCDSVGDNSNCRISIMLSGFKT